MMRRAIAFGALTAAMLAGCGANDAPSPETQAPLPKLRVTYLRHVSWGPLMIAQAEGFFRQEGLDVELVPSLNSEEQLAALVTGRIDVHPGPIHTGLLSAIARGANLRVVAGQGELAADGCTYFGIVLRRDFDPARTPIKRMRMSQSGLTRFVVSRMLAPHGIDVKSIEGVRLPEAVMMSVLERGAIDGLAVTEPTLTRLSKVGRVWIRAEDAVPGLQWGLVTFGERLLTRDRELGVRFIRAYNRGVDQYRKGKTPRNVAIISEATGEPEDIIREACWLTFRGGSEINWETLVQFQRWANAEGLMEHTLSRDQLWDSTFVTASAARSATSSQ
jgi:NitT/TauT family transport system substrate-binding protein